MARRSSSFLRRGILATVLALTVSSVAAAPAVASDAPGAPTGSVAECDAVSSTSRVPAGKQGHDPNDLTPAEARSAEALLAARVQQYGLSWISDLSDFQNLRVTVPVHVHVITRDDGSGAPSPRMLADQLAVLNTAFAGAASAASAPTIFRFEVRSFDVTRNSDWYDWSLDTDTDDVEAKTALRRGGPADLNVYITGLQDGLLGYASLPFEEPLVLDGVVVLNESLPGGAVAPYNLGDTLTHEVGHWLGLFHTFENGCEFPGDGVPDTPYQAAGDNIFFCNESDDTCPAPGRDPVHNFMSYGDDLCMDRFTLGQSVRMGLSWFVFRGDRSQLLDLLH